jgi:MSHA biogenesis protein MshI
MRARAAAVVSCRPGKPPRLLHVVSEGPASGMLPWRATQAMLEKLPQKKAPVSAVLDSSDYQLLLTDNIDLPQEERRAAVRWKIRDQISMAAEEAVIDVFELPESRGQPGMLQVIVASPGSVNDLEAIVTGASRELDVIDIPELALRNLIMHLPQDTSGSVFVLLGRSAVNILVSWMGVLFVARRIDVSMGLNVEQLALELQRSVQYYESQFDRAPVNEIVIGPDNPQARDLAPQLAEACGLQCTVLDLPSILAMDPGMGPVDQPEMLLAIGAALRPTREGPAS